MPGTAVIAFREMDDSDFRCPECEWLGHAENAIVEAIDYALARGMVRCPKCLAKVEINRADEPIFV